VGGGRGGAEGTAITTGTEPTLFTLIASIELTLFTALSLLLLILGWESAGAAQHGVVLRHAAATAA